MARDADFARDIVEQIGPMANRYRDPWLALAREPGQDIDALCALLDCDIRLGASLSNRMFGQPWVGRVMARLIPVTGPGPSDQSDLMTRVDMAIGIAEDLSGRTLLSEENLGLALFEDLEMPGPEKMAAAWRETVDAIRQETPAEEIVQIFRRNLHVKADMSGPDILEMEISP